MKHRVFNNPTTSTIRIKVENWTLLWQVVDKIEIQRFFLVDDLETCNNKPMRQFN